MLLELTLRNFKPFADVDQIAPMSNITLIYGPNSSGKSSIVQALLMLKQTALRAGDAATIWGLITRGEYVDLGSYLALLHNHDQERQLRASLTYTQANSACTVGMAFQGVTDIDSQGEISLQDSAILSEVTYQILDEHEILAQADLKNDGGSWWDADITAANTRSRHKILDFSFDHNFLPELKLLELEQLIEKNQEQLTERTRGLVRERARLRQLEQDQQRSQYDQLRNMSAAALAQLPPLDRDLNKALETMHALTRMPDSDLLQALDCQLDVAQMMDFKQIPTSFKRQLQSLRYLGPIRSHAERLYKVPGLDSYFSGLRGEFTHHRLYYQPGLVHLVNEWFEKFEIPYTLSVRPVGDMAISGEYIALVLTDRTSGTEVTLADVGFGINQILPIIVEGVDFFTGGDDRILCVEQPEIHLHPKLQANLADLMISNIAGRGAKQWIVETHSELLVLRLQRRVRERLIKPSDISVLYVDAKPSTTGGSQIRQLRLDDQGDFIDPWPDGFFEEGFGELMA